MNRDYINWLETLPCNQRAPRINTWMGGWAPLPEHVDVPAYEAWKDRENQRDPRSSDGPSVALDQVKYGKPIGGSEQCVRRPFKDFVRL